MDTQQQKQYNVLLVGDSCQDIYHFGICERISPEAPVPVLKQTRIERRFGMAHNVFLNLKSFNLDVEFITNDEKIKKHRYVDDKSKSHLLRVDEGETTLLEPLLYKAIKALKNKNYDAVILSDYDKGFLRDDNCHKLIEELNDVPFFVDTKKPLLDCYDYKNCIIKLNSKELDRIIKKPKNAKLITTLGSAGASYNNKIFKTEPVEVHDVCGAGDVFLASLVFGFLKTKDLEKAIIYANKLASLSVTKFGTYVLTREEINANQFTD